jgi:palmitoyltransferase
MFFCVAVLVYENYAYNAVFLARILPEANKVTWIPIFAIFFNVVWFIALWTYVFVHFSDPGSITDQWRTFVHDTTGLDVIVSRQEWQPGKVTTNKRSNELRPERAHYCSTMCKDVLRMDHFCPWTGNTIGVQNHKHFLLLGFYGGLSGAVAVFTALPEVIGIALGYHANKAALQSLDLAVKIQFFIFAFLASAAMVLLTGLFTSHFPLACRNMTTIEELYINMPNPYDQQNWFANLEQVFGRFGWDWFLPVKCRSPMSDGFSYRRNGEVLPEGLVESYGRDAHTRSLGGSPDVEMALNRKLPEDVWYFRYTGRDRAAVQEVMENGNQSWFASFAWLGGG